MEQRLFKKGFVFVLILLVASCNISSKELVNDEKTTIVAPDDYNTLIQQAKTNTGSSRGWIEEQQLLASDGEGYDYFGFSVSIDGDNAIIGAYSDELGGSAYIFNYDGVGWNEQQKLTASDSEEDDNFGYSVSICGDNAIIGANGDDDNGVTSGSAYVFNYDGSSWVEQQKLIASDGEDYDSFGWSVSIDGDFAIIGVNMDDVMTGSVYVFKYNGTSWNEQQKLVASDAEEYSSFGLSVSIDGENILIGAPKDDDIYNDSGAAYLFKYNGTTWNEQQKLTASDGEEADNFGKSVSIDGDNAIIGAHGDDDNGVTSGSAYVFNYNGVSWNEQQKLLASDGDEYDSFGRSVSIDGDTVVIGAYAFNMYKGAAYVFNYNGVSWTGEQKLIASNVFGQDHFGWSVSINNGKTIIGAPFYYGVMGSAYVFVFENLTIPDLYCNGNVNWDDVIPGETVFDVFRVQNIGGPGTLLNWEIQSYPDWGDWTFTPDSGTDLTPEDGYFEIEVSVVAPDERNGYFHGEIIIVNSDDTSDTCNIDVSLSTPVHYQFVIFQFLERISDKFPHPFLLFRILFDVPYWKKPIKGSNLIIGSPSNMQI